MIFKYFSLLILVATSAQASPILEQAQLWNGQHTLASGPNCFGAALALTGLMPLRRHVTSEEFSVWTQSPYCAELSPSTEALAGDIGVIEEEGQAIHAFVFLESGQAFSKDSYWKEFPYQIKSTLEVLNFFHGQGGTCADCHRLVRRYHCAPFSGDVGRLKGLDQTVTQIEFEMGALPFSKTIAEIEEGQTLAVLHQKVKEAQLQLIAFKNTSDLSSDEAFGLKLLTAKCATLQLQLTQWEDPEED